MNARAPRQVAILGAGPVGLDAALACVDAGWPCTVYEARRTVGTQVRAWGHVRLFTPWEMNVSHRMRAHLDGAPSGTHRAAPAGPNCPTGDQLVNHLLCPIAAFPELAGRLCFGARVVAVARSGLLKHEQIGTGRRAGTPFHLLIDGPSGERVEHADLVLDCTGSYGHPNPLGDGGIPALGERALGNRIVRTQPRVADPARWAGTVLLVGAGKSAQTAARDLAGLPGTRVEWVVRDPSPDWGEIPGDVLPERQRLVEISRALQAGADDRVRVHTGAIVEAFVPDGDQVRVTIAGVTGSRTLLVDHLVSLTGYTGDAGLYRQLQVHECYATAAPMNLSAALMATPGVDCLAQPPVGVGALRNPEPDFFVLGVKSYGRLNTFLLHTGYEQVTRSSRPTPPPHTARRADRTDE